MMEKIVKPKNMPIEPPTFENKSNKETFGTSVTREKISN